MSSLAALFDTEALAPHGVCLLWRPELLWLHVVSDALTGLAYWSIPVVLLIVALRRRDLVFPWAFELFALFILACGATHFLSIWTLWQPDYGLEGRGQGDHRRHFRGHRHRALAAAAARARTALRRPRWPRRMPG